MILVVFVRHFAYIINMFDLIDKGALLTVKAGKLLNTMTIRWSAEGILWGQHCMVVMVSTSRYTHDLMVNAADFTVSIPTDEKDSHILKYCGRNSGRDVNKFKECNLGILPGLKTNTPILNLTGKHVECRKIYRHTTDMAFLIDDGKYTKTYTKQNNGPHTFFIGEILEVRDLIAEAE